MLDAIRGQRFCVLTPPERRKERVRGAPNDILPDRARRTRNRSASIASDGRVCP